LSETRPQTGGVVRDLKRLKSDSTATVAELREFLGQMRGKSPQEMVGLVAKSGLVWSTCLATLLFAVLLIGLTVPFVKKGGQDTAGPATTQNSAASDEDTAKPGDSEPTEEPAETASKAPTTDADGNEVDPERAVDAMGIGETKTADPDENPLEDKLDKLLDGIE
jgi:hypothetical protein